jgi:transposase
MSVHQQPIRPVPEETARVAHLVFPKGNRYMTMRDEIGTLYTDNDFAKLFSTLGQPAISPGQLALICVMQFIEDLSDRQAAEAVRSRIDWKYALNLELTDPGFDFSVLCEFRARLIEGNVEHKLLDSLLENFKAKGWVKAGGQQRTDSTHILAATRTLNRLEGIAETLRAGLNYIATVAPDWLET